MNRKGKFKCKINRIITLALAMILITGYVPMIDCSFNSTAWAEENEDAGGYPEIEVYLPEEYVITAPAGGTLADADIDKELASDNGYWEWMDKTTPVGNELGEKIFKAKYTTSGEKQTVENIEITVTVIPPYPPSSIDATEKITAEYGQTLADVSLEPLNGEYGGIWTWTQAGTTSVGNLGTKAFYAKFTASEGSAYSSSEYSSEIKISVVATTPKYSIPTDVKATFGQTLAEVIINNPSGSTSGSWNWMTPADLVGALGINIHKAKFTPSSSNYKTVENIDVSVSVSKGTPICVAPKNLTAGENQTLGEVEITNPEGNTEGVWEWIDGTQSVGELGKKTFKARFIPTDSNNYETVENIDVTVTVEIGTEAHPYIINTKKELN